MRYRFLYSAALKRLESRSGLQSRLGDKLLGVRITDMLLYGSALKRLSGRVKSPRRGWHCRAGHLVRSAIALTGWISYSYLGKVAFYTNFSIRAPGFLSFL